MNTDSEPVLYRKVELDKRRAQKLVIARFFYKLVPFALCTSELVQTAS